MKTLILLSLRITFADKRRTFATLAIIAFSVAVAIIPCAYCTVWINKQTEFLLATLPQHFTLEQFTQALSKDWGLTLLQNINRLLTVLLTIFSSFIIYGTLSSNAKKRLTLMASLTSMGAGTLQKAVFFITEALTFSIIAIPLGIILGSAVVTCSLICAKPVFGTISLLHFISNKKLLLRMALIAFASVVGGVLILLKKNIRRPIAELLKPTSVINIRLKKGILDYLVWKVFGKTGELALASYTNQKHNYRFLTFAYAAAMTVYVNLNLIIPYFQQGNEIDPTDAIAGVQLANSISFAITSVIVLTLLCCTMMLGTMLYTRKKEFAMYLSIGMGTGKLCRLIAIEWFFRCFQLFIYGLLGTYIVNILLYGIMQNVASATNFIHPIKFILYSYVLLFLLTICMTISSILQIKHCNISDAIRTK